MRICFSEPTRYLVECDLCRGESFGVYDSIVGVEAAAADLGWWIVGNHHHCPNCTTVLTPKSVEEFLFAKGWRITKSRPAVFNVWEEPTTKASVFMPLGATFSDFPDKFSTALDHLSRVYGISRNRLAYEITRARSPEEREKSREDEIDKGYDLIGNPYPELWDEGCP